VDVPRRLGSKVVLVTGGGTGIGRAVARRVAAEGAAVVIAGRRDDVGERAAGEIRSTGAEALFVAADVTVEAEVAALVAAAVDRFGRLDGAFNNAGGVAVTAPVPEVDGDGWAAELALNLTSVFHCLKAEIPAMRRSPAGGSIVNNASTGGVAGIPGLSAYVAAKHGVVGLTRSAALECARVGVRVNALVTGNVDTPLYRRLSGAPIDGDADLPAPNPTGRVASPDEIAGFVAYLLSDEAAFVTGAALAIDGGATAG
jgi:NAD(P)-dependent dehydrogenase (short-subunit alcohol dehydrogenase family)